MVYDCFLFFNEFDLLELRLNIMNDIVDKFVIVEATRTFSKKPKELNYQLYKNRYKDFHDKIIHVVVDKYPTFFSKFRKVNSWDYDINQRNHLINGLSGCSSEDVIIISDIDEIPRPEKVIEYKDTSGIKIFEQRLFYYYLNCINTYSDISAPISGSKNSVNINDISYWRGTAMFHFKDIDRPIYDMYMQRNYAEKNGHTIIKEAGWHFSYLGGVNNIINKIKSASHVEFDTDYFNDPVRIEKVLNQGIDLFDRNIKYSFVNIDETYPKFLLQNIEKFKHLIKQ